LIRVQNLNLQPAPGGSKLAGSMTLVASYQRKNPVQPIGSPAGNLRTTVTNAPKPAGFSGARPGKTNLAKTK